MADKIKNILVIRLSAIGDVILVSPAILNLKISFPGAKIHVLTKTNLAPLVEQMAGVDEVIEFPVKAGWRELFLMGEYLDLHRFDIILDLHGNIRSKYLMHHVTAPARVQYYKRRYQRLAAVYLNKIIDPPPHTIDLYNDAVKRVKGEIFARRPVLRLDRCEEETIDFGNNNPVVAIAPGASFPPKQWPLNRFHDLAISLHKKLNVNIVLLLTDKDTDLIKINKEIPLKYTKAFINADLPDLSCIISACDLMVSNDSGLMHLSSAVGTPVVALFGPTHPTLGFSPQGLRDIIIQTGEYCRPCSLHGKKRCFRDHQYCFENITAACVLSEITVMLEKNTKGDKALFVDRDGTLIKEKDYLKDPDEVEPEEKSIEAVKTARALGYKIIVLSNQSGVARGYFDEEDVKKVNNRVIEIFGAKGAKIDGIYYCPYLQNAPIEKYARASAYRKPAPGMVEQAAVEHNLNPFRSYVIGDKISDIQLAFVTGGRGILVRTGYGIKSEEMLRNDSYLEPEFIADKLFDAVSCIREKEEKQSL